MRLKKQILDRVKSEMDVNTVNDLTVICKKLQPMATAIMDVAGKAPSVEQLLRIAWERFHQVAVMKAVIKELNADVLRPVPHYAGMPESKEQLQLSKALGKILEVTRPLANYPPSKYRDLILKHCKVDKEGVVTLKK